jgi:hypothetical protein
MYTTKNVVRRRSFKEKPIAPYIHFLAGQASNALLAK